MQLFLQILVNEKWRFAGRGADWSQSGACDADRYDLTVSTTDDIACAHLWKRRGPLSSIDAAIYWCLQEKWEVRVVTILGSGSIKKPETWTYMHYPVGTNAKVKKSHWTDAFFRHVDALGSELRKAQVNRK